MRRFEQLCRAFTAVFAVVGLMVLSGCGGGKGAKSPSPQGWQPVSTDGSGRGILQVKVNITRAIPEVDSVGIGVLGDGLSTPLSEALMSPKSCPYLSRMFLSGSNGSSLWLWVPKSYHRAFSVVHTSVSAKCLACQLKERW